jgi:hypothetical protein
MGCALVSFGGTLPYYSQLPVLAGTLGICPRHSSVEMVKGLDKLLRNLESPRFCRIFVTSRCVLIDASVQKFQPLVRRDEFPHDVRQHLFCISSVVVVPISYPRCCRSSTILQYFRSFSTNLHLKPPRTWAILEPVDFHSTSECGLFVLIKVKLTQATPCGRGCSKRMNFSIHPDLPAAENQHINIGDKPWRLVYCCIERFKIKRDFSFPA